MSKFEKIKKTLKDLEVKIEKYPLAESPFLIDEFLLIGYTDLIKEEKAIKNIKKVMISKNNDNEGSFDKLNEYNIGYLPSALTTISADTQIVLPEEEFLIKFAFPIPPKVYYSNQENAAAPEVTKIIFNNIHNQTSNTGYAYSFYEKEIVKINETENIYLFFPKAFMIISQYNYFYTFHKICEYLYNQYLSDNNEIPLEIQIYNIINFIPSPINNKIELSLFPKKDLSSIKKCKNFDEYKKNGSNNTIYLEQLGGFRHSDINFCNILDIFDPEKVVQIYLQYLLGRRIIFFSENKEKLNFVTYVFASFLFPLSHEQKCFSLNPNYYFLEDDQENILTSFLSSYKNINNYKPKNKTDFLLIEDQIKESTTGIEIAEKEKDFAFAVDVDEAKIEMKKTDSFEEYSTLFEHFKTLNLDLNSEGAFDPIIRQLIIELQSLSIIIKNKGKNYRSFFIENEDVKTLSTKIQETFFRFNVLICNEFTNKFASYKEGKKMTLNEITIKKKEEGENEENEEKEGKEENPGKEELDYYFYKLFQESSFEMLDNITVTYGENEPKIDKASKRGFDNLINIIKEKEFNNLLIKEHYIDILDSIFRNNKSQDCLSLSFFEFYKYFYDNLRLFVFRNINDDYIDKKIIKKDNSENYYYKYKKIICDRELLLKYAYYLRKLPEEIKNKLFLIPEKFNSPVEKIIHTRDYYNSYEKFFIEKKIFNIGTILQFCFLNIVVLSISELKLTHFIGPIYSLLEDLAFGLRKYVELILNVSYRVLINKEIINLNEVNKYFDVYKILIDLKKMYPNDELIVLNDAINEYKNCLNESYSNEAKRLIPSKLVSDIQNTEEDNLFKFSPEGTDKKEFEKEFEDFVEKEGKIEKKISLKSDLLEEKEISSDSIYYPYTLYLKLNELIDKYYEIVDIQSIDKEEYKKLIINVIYYLRFVKIQFPENTIKFLFYCLCDEKNE